MFVAMATAGMAQESSVGLQYTRFGDERINRFEPLNKNLLGVVAQQNFYDSRTPSLGVNVEGSAAFGADTQFYKASANGILAKRTGKYRPYAKLGVGYGILTTQFGDRHTDGVFLATAGAGLNINRLKLELGYFGGKFHKGGNVSNNLTFTTAYNF